MTPTPTPRRPDAASAPSRPEPSLDEKVAFLRSPAAYPGAPREVAAQETHMSWVFLTPDRVFKLKKPVRHPYLDFSTLAAREHNCREELRLNRRLAPDTYLDVVALTRSPTGRLALGGDGDIVDWLVVMRRLPADRMLDAGLARGDVTGRDVDRLTGVLSSFYRRAEHPAIEPSAYVGRFRREQAVNRDILTRKHFAVDGERVPDVLARLDAALAANRALVEGRARGGHIVEGHGDLRPQHVCLTDPIVIFDCLEFSRELRLVDPLDELSYLGMECALLGAAWLGPRLTARVGAELGQDTPDRLVALYGAFRAVVRARLALAHLLDPVPREPARWEPLAGRYLALAEGALSRLQA